MNATTPPADLTHQPSAAAASTASDASNRDIWAAAWNASAALQKEYPTAGAYAAIKKHEASGAGRHSSKRDHAAGLSVAGKVGPKTEKSWAAAWNASAALQSEYPTVGSYVATMKRK